MNPSFNGFNVWWLIIIVCVALHLSGWNTVGVVLAGVYCSKLPLGGLETAARRDSSLQPRETVQELKFLVNCLHAWAAPQRSAK
jgi:hypothetical protein